MVNIKLQGYNLVAAFNRAQPRLVGAAIYCKDNLTNYIEAIGTGGNTRQSLEMLLNILDHSQAHNKAFLLMGDINIDYLKKNPDSLMLVMN